MFGPRSDWGSATVEAALTVICLFLAGVLIVETGNYSYGRFAVQQAANVGARVAATDGTTAGWRAADSSAGSSGCFESHSVSVTSDDGDERGARIRVTVRATIKPRLSPWPGWASAMRSVAYSRVSGKAVSVREGDS